MPVTPEPDTFARMAEFVSSLQDDLCALAAQIDAKAGFHETHWERPGGGGGRTRVLQGGAVFEKAGINTSEVGGELPAALANELPGGGPEFRATGISLVLHPLSPMVPTVHANFRRIERGHSRGATFETETGWFGGGADLTPHYLYDEDARHFHSTWRDVCTRHRDVADYPAWKQWADDYFFLPHRGEHRGVGGIFFDQLADDTDAALAFVTDAGAAFADAYFPIVEKRRHEPYGQREREHQLIRRGRYAEFNLVYDRGTRFGLSTRGNAESILMSLPDPVRWVYGYEPEPGSREAALVDVLREPRDWADGSQ